MGDGASTFGKVLVIGVIVVIVVMVLAAVDPSSLFGTLIAASLGFSALKGLVGMAAPMVGKKVWDGLRMAAFRTGNVALIAEASEAEAIALGLGEAELVALETGEALEALGLATEAGELIGAAAGAAELAEGAELLAALGELAELLPLLLL